MDRYLASRTSGGDLPHGPARADQPLAPQGFGPPPGIAQHTRQAPAKGTADYLRAVRKRLWMVLAVALLVVPPGMIKILRMPDRYRVSARIRIEPPHFDERVESILPHGSVGRGGEYTAQHYVPDQVAELKNPALAERVAVSPELNLAPYEVPGAVAELLSITTRMHPNSNTYDIFLEGNDRARIKDLLNGLLKEFADQARAASTSNITKSRQLAARSLENLNKELNQVNNEIQRMLEGSSLFGAGGKSLPEEQYALLTSQLANKRARYDEIVQQMRITKMANPRGTSAEAASPYARKIAALQQQKEQLNDWIQDNRHAMRQYNSDPVGRKVARMYQQTVNELEQLQNMNMSPDQDWATSLATQYGEEVHRLEGEVKKQLDLVQHSMPQYMAYLTKIRDREQKQQNLAVMQERLSAFDLLTATANDPVQIVLGAAEPSEPIGPKRGLYMAVVTFLGLALGIGLVCLLESIDHRIRAPEHLVAGLALPLFGVVPRMRRLADFHRGGHLWTSGLPESVEADAFRNLRASLVAATTAQGQPIVTLLVTSAKPAEGKSTAALNLAATCARCGERTLLIDADLRRPSLQPVFEAEHDLGLVDVLKGDLPWQRALIRTDVPNLDFLPSGDPHGIPIEILGTLELAQLLKAVAGHYHRVIIDGPAVLGMADCRMLGRVADAALLVVRSGTASLAPVLRAKEMLDQSRVAVAGVVFNGLDEDLDNWGGLMKRQAPAVAVRSGRGLDAPAEAPAEREAVEVE